MTAGGRRGCRRRWSLAALATAVVLGVAGCGNGQNTLDPHGGPARSITDLWWGMLAAATVVFLGAVGMLVWSWRRRHKEGVPLLGESEDFNRGAVVAFGIAIPVACVVVVFAFANFDVIQKTEAPARGATTMTVEAIGHQWFWEFRYPGSNAVTADEMHIPVGTRVRLVAKTADVIHSFWVPELNRKIDTIPGHPNAIELYADSPGRYRGQCAEFCGVQHAHMAFYVYADPPQKFRAWLARESSGAREPATANERAGRQVFLDNACADCHTIRGTPADGRIGPDLTHLASRSTLAGLVIPNRKGYLGGWILDPQHIKPGVKMPGLELDPGDVPKLLDYLESLR